MPRSHTRPWERLGYPDLLFYRAAEGWSELGEHEEALKELDQITGRSRLNPGVLHLRWRIQVRLRQWQCCLVTARTLTITYPYDPRSWVVLAETFYQTGDVQKAYRVAAVNAAQFPCARELLYDAACYACLVGDFQQAQDFFERSRPAVAVA